MHALRYGVDTIEGKSLTNISSAWENAGQWRFLVILLWARRIGPHRHDREKMAHAIDFAFRFLGKRFIGIFFDILGGFYDHKQEEMTVLIEIAKESKYMSNGRIQAAIFGLSGSHYYNHQRYAEIDLVDQK